MTLRPCFLVVLVTLAACYRHDPLYCDDPIDCADVSGRPFCDIAGEYPASDGIARTCIPDPAATDGPDAGASLTVTATAPSHLQVGATIAIEVTVARAPGSAGPIDVAVASLPPGVTAPPLAIPSSMSTGTLTVTAATDAPFGPLTLSLEAHDGTRSGRADVAISIVGVPGTQDTSFGDGGVVLVRVSPSAYLQDSIAHHDGAIIVLSDLALVRLTSDGVIDEQFGERGRVYLDTAPLGISSVGTIRLAADRDGGVVVVGHGTALAEPALKHEFFARVSRTGTVVVPLRLLHPEPRDERACGVTVAHNGKILVSSIRGTGRRIRRYDPDGTSDRTFEANLGSASWCHVLFAAPDGGVFARGDQSSVLRYDVSGSSVRAFGDGGTAPLVDALAWTTLESLPTGGFRIGGTIGSVGVWQIDDAGNPDLRFGNGGYYAYPNTPNYYPTLFAVREIADGLVAAGMISGNHSQGDGAVLSRLSRDGQPDASFGVMGVMNENDRWSIDGGFLLEGRRALFLGQRGVGELRLKRFWY
jgi:hypothetical protein